MVAGKVADVVLLDANPLDDIRNARKISAVIHRGHVADPEKLLRMVSRE
jgi:imidazolonepropionase-like amidohydrolase